MTKRIFLIFTILLGVSLLPLYALDVEAGASVDFYLPGAEYLYNEGGGPFASYWLALRVGPKLALVTRFNYHGAYMRYFYDVYDGSTATNWAGPYYEGSDPDSAEYPNQFSSSGTSLFSLALRYRTVGGPLSFFAEAGPAVTAIWAPTSSYNSADDHPGIDSGNSLEALNDLWDYRWSSLDSDFGRALFRLGVEAGGGVAFRLGPVSARATLRYRYTDGMESWLALENLSLGIALAFE